MRRAGAVAVAVAVAIVAIASCGGTPSRSNATAASTPVVAPPSSVLPTSSPTAPIAEPANLARASSPSTLSALAAEIISGSRDLPSARFDDSSTAAEVPRPVSIAIPALDVVDAPIEPAGVTESGELDVPDPRVVGWYRYGSAPTQPGATVLAAHVDFNRVPGVFRYLNRLNPGDEVVVMLSDGRSVRYTVFDRIMYDKDKLPADRVWSRNGEPGLVLLTCGGRFNYKRRSFEQNVVVFARPS